MTKLKYFGASSASWWASSASVVSGGSSGSRMSSASSVMAMANTASLNRTSRSNAEGRAGSTGPAADSCDPSAAVMRRSWRTSGFPSRGGRVGPTDPDPAEVEHARGEQQDAQRDVHDQHVGDADVYLR